MSRAVRRHALIALEMIKLTFFHSLARRENSGCASGGKSGAERERSMPERPRKAIALGKAVPGAGLRP